MIDAKSKKTILEISGEYGGEVFFESPLKGHSAIGIGGPAEVLYEAVSTNELSALLGFLSRKGICLSVLGGASNVLIPDQGLRGVVLVLKGAFRDLSFDANKATAGAALSLQAFIASCSKEELSGLEGLVGIPGTVGGAIVMNAGYKRDISESLQSVLVMDRSGDIKSLEKEDLSFGYRSSPLRGEYIVIGASFVFRKEDGEIIRKSVRNNLIEKARKQPLGGKTLGCVFKNPERSVSGGMLIEKAGLKGAKAGGAVISEKHANFIENAGGATCSDVLCLVGKAKNEVRQRFGVDLEEEIEIWTDRASGTG